MIEILLSVFYTAIFLFLIYKMKFFKIEHISFKILSSIFILKILCGVSLTLIYTYYYQTRANADIFKYFDDGKILFSAIYENPLDYLRMVTGIDSDAPHLQKYYIQTNFWFKDFNYNLYNDNRTVIRFNAIVQLFSFGYFSVHTVFMSFLSFVGLTAIYKTFRTSLREKYIELLFAVYLVPSVLLWTSGVLKEGILMFALGLLVYSFYNLIIRKNKLWGIFNISICLFILAISKFYVLLAAIPGLVLMLWLMKTHQKRPVLKFFIVHAFFFLLLIVSPKIIGYNAFEVISAKQRDFVKMVNASSDVGSAVKLPDLAPTPWGVIKNIPSAFVNSFFRPHIFEVYSPMVLLAAFENLIILILIIASFVFMKRNNTNKALLYFALSFVIILFLLSGLTTPVLGALVRYKSPALPFLFILFLFFIDKQKIHFSLSKINFQKE